MGINKFNSEGYYDPTPYAAFTNIIKEEKAERKSAFKPLVYICSPYSGDIDKNIRKARDFCRFAIGKDCIPLAPHLLFQQFMDDENPKDRELAIFMNMVLLGKCNQLWVFGNTISSGMAQEIEKAKKRKQLIRYFNEKLQEVNSL